MISSREGSRNFYNNVIAPMISEKFPEYESRIAVGICGEGSDCFGYDDFISRDHDFGTGVVLWLTEEDMNRIGGELIAEYDILIDRMPGNNLTERLKERRGVMTIRGFYSNILGIDCDIDKCKLSEDDWYMLDHNCLATAVNGEVFRDDLGKFSAFRNMLLDYYPDKIWKIRIVNELHKYSSALQVNYARCMSRKDVVAARLCQIQGLEAAMQLFFLMKRVYPPYYKWIYRKLEEIDNGGEFSVLIKRLSNADIDISYWKGEYNASFINISDPIVDSAEQIAALIVEMLRANNLTHNTDPYLERYVDEIEVGR